MDVHRLRAYCLGKPGASESRPRHWNTVRPDGAVADDDACAWIDDSYDLVVDGLPRGIRSELRSAGDPP